MNRSIPIAKAMDDAMIVLYQNGERIKPSNGYPMRLLLPGYEGNMNVKWLHRIKLIEAPVMAINETMQYTYARGGTGNLAVLLPAGGQVLRHPSVAGADAEGPGLLRDLRPRLFGQRPHRQGRWSRPTAARAGRQAALQAPVLSKALTRFRMPWRWDGQPVVLQSRAWDEAGNVQPTRAELIAERGEPKVNRPGHRLPDGAHECHHELGHRRQGGGEHVYA